MSWRVETVSHVESFVIDVDSIVIESWIRGRLYRREEANFVESSQQSAGVTVASAADGSCAR
jgi:hypothetical protein